MPAPSRCARLLAGCGRRWKCRSKTGEPHSFAGVPAGRAPAGRRRRDRFEEFTAVHQSPPFVAARQLNWTTEGTDEISPLVPRHLNSPSTSTCGPISVAQVVTDRQSIEFERVPNPAVCHVRRIQLPCRGRNPAAGTRDRVAKCAGTRMRDGMPALSALTRVGSQSICRTSRSVVTSAMPIPIALPWVSGSRLADEDPPDRRQSRPRVVFAAGPAIDDFRVHARAADVLAHLVDDQDVEIARQPWHPGLRQREVLFVALFHARRPARRRAWRCCGAHLRGSPGRRSSFPIAAPGGPPCG